MGLNNQQLIDKIINDNEFVSTLAKEELFKRDLSNLTISNDILNMLVNKLTIDEIWNLFKMEIDSNFKRIVILKLNQILNYYRNSNIFDFLDKNEDDDLFFKKKLAKEKIIHRIK